MTEYTNAMVCLLGGLLLVGGCMVGPDYEVPQTPVDPNQGYVWLPAGWTGADDPNAALRWWESLGDATINEVVEDVLANNMDLRRAAANMERAEAVMQQVYGLRLPQVDYSLNASRARQGFDVSFFPGGDFVSFYSTSFDHGFSVSYVTDLFGRLKRSHRAAIRDLQATEADRVALAHGIVAMAIDLRVQVSTAQKLLQISNARIETWERSVQVIERRYEGGLGSPVDLYLAKERLADSRAAKSQSQEVLALALNALDVMRGRMPQGRMPEANSLPTLPPLTPVPMGLPAGLLERRPDVIAAERRVAAATERIGEAVAERYPDLTIGLGLGASANDLDKLLDWQYRTLQAAAQLTAPLFSGGRLKANVRRARAEAEISIQDYVSAVLTAVREVENTLVKGQTFTEQLTHYVDQLRQSTEAERLSTDRYVRGVDAILVVLEAERRRRTAEYQIAVTEGGLWRNRISLYLSLGGEWGLSGY